MPKSIHNSRDYSAARGLRRVIQLPMDAAHLGALADSKLLERWSTFTLDQRV